MTIQELRAQRQVLGLTQQQLAKLTGFCRCIITLWETGARIPNQWNLQQIEYALRNEAERQARVVDDAFASGDLPDDFEGITVRKPKFGSDTFTVTQADVVRNTPKRRGPYKIDENQSKVAKTDEICQKIMSFAQVFECRTTKEKNARLGLLAELGTLAKLATLH